MNRSLLVLLSITLIIGVFVITQPPPSSYKESTERLFEIGDCVRLDVQPDEFGIRKPIIKRILRVGYKSYLAASIEYAIKCQDGDNLYCDVIDFSSERFYLKTSCNP